MRLLTYFLALSILLVGCSEEKVNETEQSSFESIEPTEVEREENIKEKDLEEIPQVDVENTTVPEKVTEESTSHSLPHEKNSEIGEIVVFENGEELPNNDLYSYYVGNENPKQNMEFEKVEENIISLPKLKNNEKEFEGKFDNISIDSLYNEDIVMILTEEVPIGALIVFKMYKLLEKYPAKSYSLFYNDEEYSIIIEESDPSVGMILLEEPSLDKQKVLHLELNILGK